MIQQQPERNGSRMSWLGMGLFLGALLGFLFGRFGPWPQAVTPKDSASQEADTPEHTEIDPDEVISKYRQEVVRLIQRQQSLGEELQEKKFTFEELQRRGGSSHTSSLPRLAREMDHLKTEMGKAEIRLRHLRKQLSQLVETTPPEEAEPGLTTEDQINARLLLLDRDESLTP